MQFDTIFEKIGDSYFVFDLSNVAILEANRHFCSQIGLSREEVLRLDLSAFLTAQPSLSLEEMLAILQEVPPDATAELNLHIKYRQGKTSQVLGKMTRMTLDDCDCGVMVLLPPPADVEIDALVEAWLQSLNLRTGEPAEHTERVTQMALVLAEALGVPEDQWVHIRRGAMLHDIGKFGVPDQILLKPGLLNAQEWQVMRQHPVLAEELIRPVPSLVPAIDIPLSHHEKWDGSGYPNGLKGEEIPFTARIFAVADVWDSLSSDRPYRPAWTRDKVLQYIQELRGTHLDPRVVDKFMAIFSKSNEA